MNAVVHVETIHAYYLDDQPPHNSTFFHTNTNVHRIWTSRRYCCVLACQPCREAYHTTHSKCTPIDTAEADCRAAALAPLAMPHTVRELLVGVNALTPAPVGSGPVNALAPATNIEHTTADFMVKV